MDTLDQEKDYIILRSIVRCGFSAMPQDYGFLSRYSMKGLYFEILSRTTAGGETKYLEADVKQLATKHLFSCELNALRDYREQFGNKGTKELLGQNKIYWSTFLNILKRLKK